MTTSDEVLLRVFEGKILRKIFGPLHVGDNEYRRRWNVKLYELYDDINSAANKDPVDPDPTKESHFIRIDTSPALKVFDAVPAGGIKGSDSPSLR